MDDLEKAMNQDKFGMRKGFQGAEGGSQGHNGPVEFEKETLGKPKVDKDVFGLDTFLNKAKKGKRARDQDDDSDDDRRNKK